MSFLDRILGREKKTAAIAKERLQVILAHEHNGRTNTADYLPALKQEIMAVIAKYVQVNLDDIKVSLERQEEFDVLELNITLPEGKEKDSDSPAKAE